MNLFRGSRNFCASQLMGRMRLRGLIARMDKAMHLRSLDRMLLWMPRRLIVPEIRAGANVLPQDQAHHARDVLRLRVGDEVELFTAAGDTASGTIVEAPPQRVVVNVTRV